MPFPTPHCEIVIVIVPSLCPTVTPIAPHLINFLHEEVWTQSGYVIQINLILCHSSALADNFPDLFEECLRMFWSLTSARHGKRWTPPMLARGRRGPYWQLTGELRRRGGGKLKRCPKPDACRSLLAPSANNNVQLSDLEKQPRI